MIDTLFIKVVGRTGLQCSHKTPTQLFSCAIFFVLHAFFNRQYFYKQHQAEIGKKLSKLRHVLDLYCVQLSSAAPFCKNYTKLYLDAKHSEKELNRVEGEIFGALLSKNVSFFIKKCPFWPMSNAALNF